ncbi:MAG: DUF2589 domain-containing protein [Chitinophagales bacterium]|nr:DUF2589 domain-containing protein [Chitinophagales bacterium]
MATPPESERQYNQHGLSEFLSSIALSIIDANEAATYKMLECVKHLGFENDDKSQWTEWGDPRMIHFNIWKQGAGGKVEKSRISIPILSLISLPLLQIKECDVQFSARIAGLFHSDEEKDKKEREEKEKDNSFNTNLSSNRPKATISLEQSKAKASPTASASVPDDDDSNPNDLISFKLHFYEPDLPAGWSSMLNIIKNSITISSNKNTSTYE